MTAAPELNITAGSARSPKSLLAEIQAPIRRDLDEVSREMQRIVSSDLPLVGQVSTHLLAMRGKLFRPTILLVAR